MRRSTLFILALSVVVLGLAGCTDQMAAQLASLQASNTNALRVYLVNKSTTKFVSPKLGLCSTGLDNLPHDFIQDPPVLAPGQAVSYSSLQISSDRGNCSTAGDQFMIGLCGWKYGDSATNLTSYPQRYGGQIGFQFQCGDTIILRWNDGGPDCGAWTSEVLTAPGNAAPTADFQLIDGISTCTG
jgi:hypothetical protein